MPELPEVETIVRELNEAKISGKKIIDLAIYWKRSILKLEPAAFRAILINQTIRSVTRRGKFIVFTLDQGCLFLHLRMTGKLAFVEQKTIPLKPERLRLLLNDGRVLRYEDQRKFGKWHFVKDGSAESLGIGLEPFSKDFTEEAFKALMLGHKQKLKPFLLNQKYVVGLGNIYVDEALWESFLHPERLTSSLTDKEIKALYKVIPKVLQKGIDNLGTSLGAQRANYFSVSGRRGGNQYKLNVFRRDGDPCPRCGTTIIKTVVAQRGTHLCPHCQISAAPCSPSG